MINSLCPIQVPHIRIFGRRTQLAVGQHKTWEYVITFLYPRLLNLVSAHARMLRLAFSPRAQRDVWWCITKIGLPVAVGPPCACACGGR